jgi:hypothetical protein
MSYSFSGGLILSLIFLTVAIALPVKLAAHMAGARRTGFAWCGLAVAVGILGGYVASSLAGGVVGGPLASLVGFVIGIRVMLGTSFLAALGLSVVAVVLSLLGLSILAHVGLIAASSNVAVST